MNQPAKPHANYFKLGLFVIVSFFLFAAFLIVFGAGQFMKKKILAETCFDESVQGLDVGSDVKYKGVKVGSVNAITTPAKIYGKASNFVLVIFALEEDSFLGVQNDPIPERIRQAVETGLRVQLSYKGLTGAAYLETDFFQNVSDDLAITWEPENIYIPSRKSNIRQLGDALNMILENLSTINIQGMMVNLESLLKNLDQKTAGLNLDDLSDQATAMLAEIRQTNQKLSDTLGSAEFTRMIADAQGAFTGIKTIVDGAKAPVRETLSDLRQTAKGARDLTQGLESRMDVKLKQMSGQIDTLMTSLNTTVKMMETLVWLNTDTINKTIDNFEVTSENLKQLSIEIKHYPGRLLFEKPPEKLTGERIRGEK